MSKAGTHILVAEDNEDDVFFMRRAMKAAAPDFVVSFVNDGQSALEFLRATGPYQDRVGLPLPAIVFLDLKLPYFHGMDVLAEIRRDPHLRAVPVVILTSSSEDHDRMRAESLGVQGYLVKPPTRAMLIAVLNTLIDFPRADSAML